MGKSFVWRQFAGHACIPEGLGGPQSERTGSHSYHLLPQNMPDSGQCSLRRVRTLSPDSHQQAGR